MNSLAETRIYPILQRVGAATFAIFLIKGLLWIAAPFIFLWFA